jgi:hypothetical protein
VLTLPYVFVSHHFHPLCAGADGAQYAGNNTCANVGPIVGCPTTPAAGPTTAVYVPGEKIDVILMKNLDHWNSAAPGNFSVYLWDSNGASTFIAATPDTNAPSQSLYELLGFVPATATAGPYVLQTIYYPNNNGAPPSFYQCSDVTVLVPVASSPAQLEAAYKACAHEMRKA